VLLDEVVLEQEGFGLGGGDHPLDVPGASDHLGGAAVRRLPAATEVRGHALAQRLGLAHV